MVLGFGNVRSGFFTTLEGGQMISELSREFIVRAYQKGALLLDDDYELSSGVRTPVYFNGRRLFEGGSGLAWCENLLLHFLTENEIVNDQGSSWNFDAIYGPAYGAIPHPILLARKLFEKYNTDVAWFFDRKEEKRHGEGGRYVGVSSCGGKEVLVIEDAVTSGRTLRVRLDEIIRCGGKIAYVVVLFDREEYGFSLQSVSVSETLEEYLGAPVLSIATMTDLMLFLGELGRDDRLNKILQYREGRRREMKNILEDRE